MWHCLNLVCGPEGTASGRLLCAGEIIAGADLARRRHLTSRRDADLAQGPARPVSALDVDRSLNGGDVCALPITPGPFRILSGSPSPPDAVRTGPRTGVGGEGAAHPWRYWIDDDPTVSPYRAHTPRKRR